MPDPASLRDRIAMVRPEKEGQWLAEVEDYTKAMLNILEDAAAEKKYLEEAQHAILNILEDSADEKAQLEEAQRAFFNILEDISGEKEQFEDTQRALANILEDSMEERGRLEENQRAMLNLLEDFDEERMRSEAANRETTEALESLRKAKEATDAANKELEAFSYSVSHDLRTPLQSIDGFSLALLEDYGDYLDDRGKDYLRRVRNATQRMAQLIDDLLKLSRLTRSELNPVTVDLSALAARVATELQAGQPDRNITFRIREGLTVTGDADLLKVLFDNLIGNAWKFTSKKEEAVIEFGTADVGGEETFFVRDNGTGFDMAYADKLFAPFQRLHLEKDFPGTGIGLSIVQRIIHRHDGRIWADAAVGKGATFFFTLNLGIRER
ncbi:ATP-binding protein [Geobacter sp. DSM 9736]|uniref:sensor histidine kinase n=1 Tax=Geobacter sp. DSM 9736 TaxID=1277350 RepID=UPI000B501086|nr:ATP-binding protein [Geobacter sp. DSM 9736]SNB46318.1 His Kinase A (phospho-acceptor) domain-containing protein [Geobacter sp. DSM 9736]